MAAASSTSSWDRNSKQWTIDNWQLMQYRYEEEFIDPFYAVCSKYNSQCTEVRLDWHGIYPGKYSCLRTCQWTTGASLEKISEEAKTLYKNYQSQIASLSETQRGKKEEEIVAKEKSAAELRRKYFGPEGELYKKRESLMQPIQDEIYNAVKEIATQNGYAAVVDRASASSIIFASPSIDVSNEVLAKLGYSN